MKFVVKIVLIVFLVFLSTPTIVSLIEKNTDTSFFFDLSEEEEGQKEFKADFKFYSAIEFVSFSIATSNLILSENLSKHDNIAATIFVTPPEQV